MPRHQGCACRVFAWSVADRPWRWHALAARTYLHPALPPELQLPTRPRFASSSLSWLRPLHVKFDCRSRRILRLEEGPLQDLETAAGVEEEWKKAKQDGVHPCPSSRW